jgi:hypothetical protein
LLLRLPWLRRSSLRGSSSRSKTSAARYAPFNEYNVDFFLALPDEAAVQRVRSRLESDGFSVDAKPMTEKTDLPFSLHASKSMRLIVPDMQAMSTRLDALAEEFGGRYDGWTA